MAVTLDAIHARIAELTAELNELHIAAKVFKKLDSSGQPESVPHLEVSSGSLSKKIESLPEHVTNDLLGKTITECAKLILSERDEAHFVEIADLAMFRGYKSGRPTDNPTKSVRQSFWAMMKRHSDQFVATGKGRFRLAD